MRIIGAGIAVALLSLPAAAADAGRGRPARAADARDARALAARIDEALSRRWAEAKVTPAARADDGEFLRRVSLDLVGKVPAAAEARDFLDDPNPEKRAALVARLLDSPAYAARATALWRKLLLPEAPDPDGVMQASGGFEAWLRKKVVEEAGYDQIVREILTVRLDGRAPEPSPAAFYATKQNKPEVLASDSARAFLGLRLECAQCHDHPFAKWKREEFWGYAAFFAGVPGQQPDANGLTMTLPREDPNKRELTIPGTKTVVPAAHLDRSPPAFRPRADAREALAAWITAADNPYFARAAVNRVWASLFGVGLVEPVDDLDAAAEPGIGPLLDELALQFRDHGYDLKFLIRALTATRAYNLSSSSAPGESTPPPLFACMPVRGLAPAQVFDSLVQATGAEPGEARARFAELFADRDEKPVEAQATILQALTMMNGTWMASATNPESGPLIGAVAEAPYLDTAGRIEVLYLAALTRRPRTEELARLVGYVDRREGAADRARALADVFWALLNGPEFRLNH